MSDNIPPALQAYLDTLTARAQRFGAFARTLDEIDALPTREEQDDVATQQDGD